MDTRNKQTSSMRYALFFASEYARSPLWAPTTPLGVPVLPDVNTTWHAEPLLLQQQQQQHREQAVLSDKKL